MIKIDSIDKLNDIKEKVNPCIYNLVSSDFKHMLKTLKELNINYDSEIHGYCIITNSSTEIETMLEVPLEEIIVEYLELKDDNIIVTLVLCNNEFGIQLYIDKSKADKRLKKFIDNNL